MVVSSNEIAVSETAFQEQMVALTRAFGWHRPTHTPCGQPVSIAEAHALLELSRVRSMTQQELADKINLQKSTVSRLVSGLEARDWIARRRNGDDGRARDVFLTPTGEGAAADLASARRKKMDGILDRIPLERRGALADSLQLLIEAIHESND